MKKYKIITFLIAALESQFSGYNNNMQIILNETIQCNQSRIGITNNKINFKEKYIC